MNAFIVTLNIFVYVIMVSPISEVSLCHRHELLSSDKEHVYTRERHCVLCPRNSRCVPRIQCPALIRPGSYNPECLLDSSGSIGVCCFTGSRHASDCDLKLRSSSISEEVMKLAHRTSHQKLTQWMDRANTLVARSPHSVMTNTSPSFAHHLSMATYDQRADELGQGGLLNVFATQELKALRAISDNELTYDLTNRIDGPFCPPRTTCPNAPSRYRSIGGECNNIAHPSWGAANTGFERVLPPDYSDGIWDMKASASGRPLPSARKVSAAIIPDVSQPSPTHSMIFMQFGQFVAHDISAGVVFTLGNGSAISCCTKDGENFLEQGRKHWSCAPIAIEPDDIFFEQYRQRCMSFVRSQVAPTSDCSVGYAKQMNGATHYLDLSHLYGSTSEKVGTLRAPKGLLAVFNDYGRELPPLTTAGDCASVREGAACFDSGDNHGNQIISLTVFHTIWTREHNRIARAFNRLNPSWDEDTVFFETRRLVQAEFQHILYNEYLPLLLGPQIMQMFELTPSIGYSSSYDRHVNPSLTAEFSSSAMRFGHSVVDGRITIPYPSLNNVCETMAIPDVMFQPSHLRLKHFLDRTLLGMSRQPMQSVDPFVTEGLTRYLFHGSNPFGLDLASINIQRGRDWGVRSYNEYRRLIGLPSFESFYQYSSNTVKRLLPLSSVYSSPKDVDLWIGGLLEEPVEGGVVGATFAHIIADQFSKLKRGDRYFYENDVDVNPGSFTSGQLAEIKKVTLARILCDNADGVELFSLPPRAFLRADLPGNEPVQCDNRIIPSIDLSKFRKA